MKVVFILSILAVIVLAIFVIKQRKELANADTYIGNPLLADYRKTPKAA